MDNQDKLILIIGYGNPLRGDDGVAGVVLDELAGALVSRGDIELIRRHQLDVVDAEAISRSRAVIFIDAHIDEARDDVWLESIEPSGTVSSSPLTAHISAPEDLTHLARRIYDASPTAFVCAIRGYDFSFGAPITEPVLKSVPIAAEKIMKLLETLEHENNG